MLTKLTETPPHPSTQTPTAAPFERLLNRLGTDLRHHARLINTFSLMEYIGARKILKSQHESRVTDEMLNHMAEEIRHAQILKRLALKLSDGKLNSYSPEHILGGLAPRTYMQAIDQGCTRFLGLTDPWQSYLGATWLIEERALSVYPPYEKVLTSLGYAGYLRAILKDEEKHLADVRRDTDQDMGLTTAQRNALQDLEAQAFDELLSAIENDLTQN